MRHDDQNEEDKERRLEEMRVTAGHDDAETGVLSTARVRGGGRDCVGPVLGATSATSLVLMSAKCLGNTDAAQLTATMPASKETAKVLKVIVHPDAGKRGAAARDFALVITGAGLVDRASPLFILKPDRKSLSEMKNQAMNVVAPAADGVTGLFARGTASRGALSLTVKTGCSENLRGAPVVVMLPPQHYVAAVVAPAKGSCPATFVGADAALLAWIAQSSVMFDVKACERRPDNHVRCEDLRR